MGALARPLAGALLALLALAGCADDVPDPVGARPTPPRVAPLAPESVVPGSVIIIDGGGFLRGDAGQTVVRLRGEVRGAGVDVTLSPARVQPDRLELVVGDAIAEVFRGRAGRLTGTLTVIVSPADQPWDARTEVPLLLDWAPFLEPTLAAVEAPDVVAPGALLPIAGDGLIDGAEGQTVLVMQGRFTTLDDEIRSVDVVLPLFDRQGRRRGRVFLEPGALGLAEGRFRGRAQLRTTSAAGVEQETAPVDLAFAQGPPRVRALSPEHAARGQSIALLGEGFLPGDANARTATLVHAVGAFGPEGEAGAPVDLLLLPEAWIDNGEVRLALRTVIGDDGPTGFGASAGRFVGQIWVELLAGFERAESAPVHATFTVDPATQWVRLVYLPGFRESLARFGLAGAEDRLRALILAVCERDYAGLRVFFAETMPPGQAEHLTVEIGGRDPNGLGLFGADNSPVKDDDNWRLDELLGGRNAESAAAGSFAYGGIFLESFLALSPSQPDANLLADPRFDEVFGPFSPALSASARPLAPGEVPGGARAAQADRALSALANLVGSTITQEVGHALGLARVPGEVHNPQDTDGGLMDAGGDRPFVERAALDGTPPARFLEPNRSYLRALFGD
ncbi:MAG: hypothetical protein R3F60_28010 [bacterium]